MSRANELWQEKGSPLWLLLASRALAQYPTAKNINNERVNEYVDQFAYGVIPDLKDRDFTKKIHPGHKELFEIIAKEALAYYDVFYDAQSKPYDDYTAELVAQFDKAYAPERTADLKHYQINENRHAIGNIVVAIAMAAIRDMALVEDLYRQGKMPEEEHNFALKEINDRMSRVGINGVDRLLESRPELEQFIKHDIREIDVGHITGELQGRKKTRAACYNVTKGNVQGFSWSKESTTDLRQDVISADFPALEKSKDGLILRLQDLIEPTPEVRAKLSDYGKTAGRGTKEEDKKSLALLQKISSELDKRSFSSFDEYYNFLIHDGIAINHPKRDAYTDKIRHDMHNKDDDITIIQPGEHVDADDITPMEDTGHNPELLPAIIIKKEPHIKKDDPNIEDVDFEEIPSMSAPNKKEEVTEVKAEVVKAEEVVESHEQSKDKSEAPSSKTDEKKPDSASTENTKEKKEKYSTGSKIAALGGAAALTGLLLSSSGHKERDKDVSNNADLPAKNQKSNLKPLAFVAASAVTIGGAIMWSKKPEVLYKPLKELIDKLIGGIGR